MPHRQRLALAERLRQLRREYQVAQAQRREGNLAEGADVQYAPVPVEGRQRGQGRAAVSVLTVVIVLDDPAIVSVSPGQQFQAARQAHGHPGRVLVGRRHIGHPTILQLPKPAAIHPLPIHRYAAQLATRQCKGVTGRPIARVFHSYAVARL
jgi:hypothetical protein